MIGRSIPGIAIIGLLVTGAIARVPLPGTGPDTSAAYLKQSAARAQSSRANGHVLDDGKVEPVMWQDPVDLESRDLFYGIGGKNGAPNLTDRFRFIKKVTSGHRDKLQVEDSRERIWTVKFGAEPGPETAATRIVWAVGYHVDQAYFVEEANVEGWGVVRNVRFERDNDGYKKVGRWDWGSNPFTGTRALDGLRVLMAVLNNWDLKTDNNKIIKKNMKSNSSAIHIYYVTDLGATLGSTGKWFGAIPLFGELPAGSKGSAKDFSEQEFIQEVRDGKVSFFMKRARAKRAITGVRVEHARWMGDLLARLSDKQLSDAVRAGHFPDDAIQLYVRTLRGRIKQLQQLK